jgi:hypothetical protein
MSADTYAVIVVPIEERAAAHGSLRWWFSDLAQGVAALGQALNTADPERLVEMAREVLASAAELETAATEARTLGKATR